MNIVNTRARMRWSAYKFIRASRCKYCGAPIEWWDTLLKRIPLDPVPVDENAPTTLHWQTCAARNKEKI
jgi:hypothetical protein